MIELSIIIILLVFNGVFAMAEISLVSAKRARLQQRAEKGDRGAKIALRLTENPERFLSTVQIGITLVGVLAGAFGGASLSDYLTPHLAKVPALAPYAENISFGLIVAFITYLSLIIGELVPKGLALRNPENIACMMAGPMDWISRIASPLVGMLEFSTRLVMRLFGKAEAPTGTTRDEVEVLVREGIITGGVRREESDMVEGVFDLRDLRAEEIMRPKPRLVFFELHHTAQEVAEMVTSTSQKIFPVHEGTRDQVVGLVSLLDLYGSVASGKNQAVSELMKEPVFVSENQPALTLLDTLRNAPHFAALVTDEFGILRGMVTVEDLVDEVLGDLISTSQPPPHDPTIRQLAPDNWIVDGLAEIDTVAAAIPGLEAITEADEKQSFQTLAGFIVHHLERLPNEGDTFTAGEFHFDIIDMDRQRIDKVGIRKIESPADPEFSSTTD